jgi:hypothetical protein
MNTKVIKWKTTAVRYIRSPNNVTTISFLLLYSLSNRRSRTYPSLNNPSRESINASQKWLDNSKEMKRRHCFEKWSSIRCSTQSTFFSFDEIQIAIFFPMFFLSTLFFSTFIFRRFHFDIFSFDIGFFYVFISIHKKIWRNTLIRC